MVEPSTYLHYAAILEKQKTKSLLLRQESIKSRKNQLRALEQFLLKNRQRIQLAVNSDLKKPFMEVDLSELYPVLGEIRTATENLDRWARSKKIDSPLTYFGSRAEIKIEPKGVCLIISPWNYPFNLCFGPLISCIAAGNTAFIKPSEMTPNTSKLISALVSEFFDESQVKVIEGDSTISTELLKLPFDHIFFTGSPAIGKVVMRAAAENLTSVTLELGGKSPTIVDETANLAVSAKRIVFGKFLNNGQTCVAPDYILIHRDVKDSFIEHLKKEVIEMFGENGTIDEESKSYARLINQKHFNRITAILKEAVAEGAKIEMDGKPNENTNFLPPTILSNISISARIMEEEIFGPVLPIITYSSEEEAINLINSKPKPLALYVFSERKSFHKKVLSQTSAGTTCINDCVIQFAHPNLPFGGVNNSGIGKSHGYAGFLEFSNQRSILNQLTRFSASSFIYPPFTPKLKLLVDMMLKYF